MSEEAAKPVRTARPLTAKFIQGLVLFSTILGVLFLVQVKGALPSFVFEFVAFGWVLFVIDSILTFVAPRPSYMLAFVLAILALGSSLPQSAHYAFLANGDLLPAATFVVGSAAQFLLIVLVPYHFIAIRSKPT